MNISRWIIDSFELDNTSDFTDKLLHSKGIDLREAEEFLSPQLSFLTPSESVVGLKKTGDILRKWISDGRKILVFGDYDVDGVTSTAILVNTLRSLGGVVAYYIPNRFESGYGLSYKAVEDIIKLGVDALITVDTGITSVDEVNYLREMGIDVIVTDHHKIPDVLPQAVSILNPKLSDPESEYYDLCGAGTVYMLSKYICEDETVLGINLQLATIGTVADLVPLTRDNRIIVKCGLDEIRRRAIKGIKSLAEVAGINISTISEGDIGFKLAPRINAAGRLDDASTALNLFVSNDDETIHNAAETLDKLNTKRREFESSIFSEAVKLIESDDNDADAGIIIVYGEEWHEGVLGIVASRITEKYNRPSLVLNNSDGILKGSGRSISGFSIYSALYECRDLFIKFGGHDQALGLTMDIANLDQLKEHSKQYWADMLSSEVLVKKNKYSFNIISSDITNKNYDVIKEIRPYGIGNPTPVFRTDGLLLGASRLLGRNSDVLKMELLSGARVLNAIKFKDDRKNTPKSSSRIDLLYKIEENNFRGVTSLQIQLKDYRVYSKTENTFTHWAFSNYAISLFDKVIMNDGYGFSPNNTSKVSDLYQKGKTASALNYYDYLGALYELFDMGLSIENIRSLDALEKYLVAFGGRDVDSISTDFILPKKSNIFYKSMKEELLDELYFDRKYFLKIYTYLQSVKKTSRKTIVYRSKKPLSTLIALEFFKESGFISIEDDLVSVVESEHKKSVFADTNIHKRTIDFVGKL